MYLYLRTDSAYKQVHILQLYILQLYILQRENGNKTNALVNVPKKETHNESDDLNRINSSREFKYLPLFALLVTTKKKRQSRMLVNLNKTEFTPACVQAGSSSRTFPPGSDRCGR